MALKLDGANVVIVGKFNPYIFSPEWLTAQGIWSPKSPIRLSLGALSDGINFHTADGATSWQINPDGLTIASKLGDSAELAQRVISKLPHTPVAAVGCNFSFSSATWDSEFKPKLGQLALEDLPQEFNPELTIWSSVFHSDEIRIEMMVATGQEGATVTFNFHQVVTGEKSAIQALQRFQDNLNRSRRLIELILREDVDVSCN